MFCAAAAPLALLGLAAPAAAQEAEQRRPPARIEVKPIGEARLRWEQVEQGALDAEALTFRVRAGAEARHGPVALLVEAEATAAIVSEYNAFPFAAPGEDQWRPTQAVVADPENVEINRLQLQYRTERATVTVGRQRINLDDQRWVGSVGWRQTEQTFDAVRAEARLGPVAADVAYAASQRTIFGMDAGARTAIDGDYVFAGVSAAHGVVSGKLFGYLIAYDEPPFFGASTQTWGGIAAAALPVRGNSTMEIRASYAHQSDYAGNPADYGASYWSLDAAGTLAGFRLAGGIEILGSDKGRSVQTPLATLHKFNGWADIFLTTPPQGLSDLHFTVSRRFEKVRALPGLHASLSLHRFRSAVGGLDYGREWDASAGMRIGKIVALAKYASYRSNGFGVDTDKFWFQLEAAL